MRIALMGTGSLGTILGAYIARAGFDIDLIDSYEAHVQALNDTGARISGWVDFTQPVHALLPEEMEGDYDVVLYLAKQTYNQTAIPQIAAHIHDKSIVCVMQNGIPEYAVSAVIGEDHVVGAPVGWGATFRGPGHSELTSETNRLVFSLGALDGKLDERIDIVKMILESMGKVSVSDNLMGLRWCKLLMNATFSGLSTALGTTFGGVMDSEDAMRLIIKIGEECMNVAAALGIQVEPFEEYDFYKIFKPAGPEDYPASIEACRKAWQPSYNLTASMAQDILRGKPCEIRDINGLVCQKGRQTGVPTPINDLILEIISGMELGIYQYDTANMKYFEKYL